MVEKWFNHIDPLSDSLDIEIWAKINQKTKPIGSLGKLEEVAFKIAKTQQSLSPELKKPTILVFASDHGIVEEGVSAYPQEVTAQMVLNFLSGGAAINVFAKQHNIQLKIVDAGVKTELPVHENLMNLKIDSGTKNFLHERAMTNEQCVSALQNGKQVVEELHKQGCNVIGLGEMGIGNTSSASLIMSELCQLDVLECVGRGTGMNDSGLKHKVEVLSKAQKFHNLNSSDPMEVLCTFGGFEIVMMAGAFLAAAKHKMVLLIDGFIATSAFLVAYKINPNVKGYAIFTHLSDELGHKKMLDCLKVDPLVNLEMRLGEGSGCAVAYPLIKSAILFLNEMASFESAKVSGKTE